MAETADDYQHGDQETAQQVSTYHLFNTLTKWGSLHLAVIITMLTLWFCVGAGFLGGLVPGLVILAAGIAFLRSRPSRDDAV